MEGFEFYDRKTLLYLNSLNQFTVPVVALIGGVGLRSVFCVFCHLGIDFNFVEGQR
jgi:hypothetical protein